MIFFCVLIVLVFVAQMAEFFIPPLDWMSNAHVYITPVLVFYGAMALPLPLLLVLVFWAGFLLDALTAQVISGRVEISFGSSILLYAVLAGIMHGLRPLFARGCRWRAGRSGPLGFVAAPRQRCEFHRFAVRFATAMALPWCRIGPVTKSIFICPKWSRATGNVTDNRHLPSIGEM